MPYQAHIGIMGTRFVDTGYSHLMNNYNLSLSWKNMGYSLIEITIWAKYYYLMRLRLHKQ